MKNTALTSAFIIALWTTNSLAGTKEAKDCAANLSEPARLIFKTVVPKLGSGSNARKVIKSTTIELVKAGKVERSEARSSALSAGECLKKYQL